VRGGTLTDEIVYADIDLNEAEASHARRLFLRHRRPELYGPWVTPAVVSR
jgi:N-carbamoylputrescine amidase